MKYKTKFTSVIPIANFCIDEDDVCAVITDEKGVIVAKVVIAYCYDEEEKMALYWALRKAVEGEVTRFLITDEDEPNQSTQTTQRPTTLTDELRRKFQRTSEVTDDD
jgi:hypothetical protein